MMPEESFVNLKKYTREMISVLSSSWVYERIPMSIEPTWATVLVGTTEFDPEYRQIV